MSFQKKSCVHVFHVLTLMYTNSRTSFRALQLYRCAAQCVYTAISVVLTPSPSNYTETDERVKKYPNRIIQNKLLLLIPIAVLRSPPFQCRRSLYKRK